MKLQILAVVALLLAAPVAFAAGDDEAEDEANHTAEKNESQESVDDQTADQETESGADENANATEDEEEPSASDEGEAERDVRVEVSGTTAVLKLERESTDAEDEVKITYSADEGVMKLEYETENATLESEAELKVEFREIVEFEDADGDGAYTPDVDRSLATIRIDSLPWSIAGPDDVTSASGVAGKRLTGVASLPEGGNVSFVLKAFGGFAEVNGTSLRPTDVKIDILLHGYAYSSGTSQLALLVRTEQEAEAETKVEGGEGAPLGVVATLGEVQTYFTWADEALADGVMRPVQTTVVESETASEEDETKTESRFYFSYPRADDLNHDPVLGLASASSAPATGAKGTPAPGIAALVGALALAAGVARRSRRAE